MPYRRNRQPRPRPRPHEGEHFFLHFHRKRRSRLQLLHQVRKRPVEDGRRAESSHGLRIPFEEAGGGPAKPLWPLLMLQTWSAFGEACGQSFGAAQRDGKHQIVST